MNNVSAATAKLLSLSMLPGIGPAALRHVMTLSDFTAASIDQLLVQFPRLAKPLEHPNGWMKAVEKAEKQVEEAARANDQILSIWDKDYPALLAATPDAPFFIFVRGELSKTPEKSVAIIGTRRPTNHGKVTTERITAWCVEQALSIVSGLALGCDGIAHKQALASGGHTVAVLAHGLHTVAPSSHKKLAADILEKGGALVSEFPYGTQPIGPQFVKRDRTQAGLAQGVIMIQSDIVGGSLHASRAALKYGRWLAVPTPTSRDDAANEPKVGANRVIASTNTSAIEELLKCGPSDLQRLIVLRSREDYTKLLQPCDLMTASAQTMPPQQGGLL